MARQSIHNRRAGRGSTGGGASWISYSDMMAALLLIFVLVLTYSLYQYFTMLESKTRELEEQQKLLIAQQVLLNSKEEELSTLQITLNAKQEELDEANAQLLTREQLLAILQAQLEDKEKELSAATARLEEQQIALAAQARQLDELVGLDEVKKDVKSLINLIKVRKLRQENDLPVPPMSKNQIRSLSHVRLFATP